MLFISGVLAVLAYFQVFALVNGQSPIGESERLFLPSTLVPKSLETVDVTSTNWTAKWKRINAHRGSQELKCVVKGDSCQDPAVGVSAENLSSKTKQATVTELLPNTEYTCYVVVKNKKGLEICESINIKTKADDYVTRAYVRSTTLRRRLLQDDQDTQVCTLNSEGGLADCMSAQLDGFLPVATAGAATIGSTYDWITFLEQRTPRNKMYTCPLNPDGTAVSDACKNVFTAGGFVLYNFFNDQSTKAWMLFASPGTSKMGAVCDIDAVGDYKDCQDIIPETMITIRGIPLASPDGQSVYVPSSEGILYCSATASNCKNVNISPSFDVFNENYAGANIGFQSSNVALIAFDFVSPVANDTVSVMNDAAMTPLLRCELESPTEFLCEEYGYPFTEDTAIFGFAFANDGANVYLLTAFNGGFEAAVEYCTVGSEGISGCQRVIDLSDQEVVALTRPIIV